MRGVFLQSRGSRVGRRGERDRSGIALTFLHGLALRTGPGWHDAKKVPTEAIRVYFSWLGKDQLMRKLRPRGLPYVALGCAILATQTLKADTILFNDLLGLITVSVTDPVR